ncbi:DAK2 domain-containing protein [Rhodococcus sp. HNM0569]|nr:DAK2 domain-containing protein [Rhodococcus sp. HNM0569]
MAPRRADDLLVAWARAGVEALARRCDEINDLNVFPVPDSDTGTNLLFTMRAALAAVTDAGSREDVTDDDGVALASALAKGAVSGARGNSGVILSQVLRGFADAAQAQPDASGFDTGLLRTGLRRATELVVESVSFLVEGTIVTALREAADAASALDDAVPLAVSAVVVADAAADALGRTPAQLDALDQAGVVDAGAFGFVVLADALVEVVTGIAPARELALRRTPRAGAHTPGASGRPGSIECADHSDHDFEVMYLVGDTDADAARELRRRLEGIGDSVVIVGDGDGCWSAHVHCTDAGAAIEAGLGLGRIHDIRVSSFVVDELRRRTPRVEHAVRTERGVLAVAAGDAAADLFGAEGAAVLRCDESVTRAALLDAIRAMDRRQVLVLPNGALPPQEVVAVSAAARDSDHEVFMLATSSMVQGLAALAVHDRTRDVRDDAYTMSEAAASTRWGSLRIARERALTYVGTCEPGDGIGLMGHEVIVIDHDVASAARRLADLAVGSGGGELVTLLRGAEEPDGFCDGLTDYIESRYPGVEVVVYDGGQPGDLFQLGVE